MDRSGLVGVQTPQVFPRRVLEVVLGDVPSRAPGRRGAPLEAATDDLALVERLRDRGVLDGRILVVPGSIWARKVTYPADLALLELLAQHDAPAAASAGGALQEAAPDGSVPAAADHGASR